MFDRCGFGLLRYLCTRLEANVSGPAPRTALLAPRLPDGTEANGLSRHLHDHAAHVLSTEDPHEGARQAVEAFGDSVLADELTLLVQIHDFGGALQELGLPVAHLRGGR